MLNQELVTEWLESPVTRYLADHVQSVIDRLEDAKSRAYTPLEPQRTQEALCALTAECSAWVEIHDRLTGEEPIIEEEDEQDRDTSNWS